jgi:hypothetical protein
MCVPSVIDGHVVTNSRSAAILRFSQNSAETAQRFVVVVGVPQW